MDVILRVVNQIFYVKQFGVGIRCSVLRYVVKYCSPLGANV